MYDSEAGEVGRKRAPEVSPREMKGVSQEDKADVGDGEEIVLGAPELGGHSDVGDGGS
jgi:hypothetical protein